MDYRRFDINVREIDGFNCQILFFKKRVYAMVSLVGSSPSTQRTSIGKYSSGKNPTWDTRSSMRFYLEDSKFQQNELVLKIQLQSKGIMGRSDKIMGEVYVPLKELYDNCGGIKNTSYGAHQLITRCGKRQGFLYFTYEFGETMRAAVKKVENGVKGYPIETRPKASPSAPSLDYLGLTY